MNASRKGIEDVSTLLRAYPIEPELASRPNLKAALGFVASLHTAYRQADAGVRRRINQAIFERFLISDDGEIVGELRAPFDLLLEASGTAEQGVVLAGDPTKKPRGGHP